jgi:hypothetical protein
MLASPLSYDSKSSRILEAWEDPRHLEIISSGIDVIPVAVTTVIGVRCPAESFDMWRQKGWVGTHTTLRKNQQL